MAAHMFDLRLHRAEDIAELQVVLEERVEARGVDDLNALERGGPGVRVRVVEGDQLVCAEVLQVAGLFDLQKHGERPF